MTIYDGNGGIMVELFGSTFQTLENALDFATAKNRTISNNIANVDTPGYKAGNVDFKSILNAELNTSSIKANKTNPKHLSFTTSTQPSYRITTNPNTMYNHNENNVDIDKEMAELAQNQIYYQAIVDRLNGKFNSLQTVIRGGR